MKQILIFTMVAMLEWVTVSAQQTSTAPRFSRPDWNEFLGTIAKDTFLMNALFHYNGGMIPVPTNTYACTVAKAVPVVLRFGGEYTWLVESATYWSTYSVVSVVSPDLPGIHLRNVIAGPVWKTGDTIPGILVIMSYDSVSGCSMFPMLSATARKIPPKK